MVQSGKKKGRERRVFTGEYQHTIDDKGRLSMPAKFREALGDHFMIAKGMDTCLFVYTMNDWQILEDKFKKLPFTNKDARAFARLFFSGAADGEIDKQGRTLVSSGHRDYAGLQKDVVIIGAGSRIEIWSKETWEGFRQETESRYEELAEKIMELDLGF